MDATNEDEQKPGKLSPEYGQKILERIRAAEKREKLWMDDATAAEKAYAQADNDKEAGTGKVYDFNILHSNVETIVPAIYNSTPAPDIRPRRIEASGQIPKEPKPPEQPQGPEGAPLDPRAMMQFQQAMAQYQQEAQAFAAKKQLDEDTRNYARLMERAITVQIDDNALDTEIEAVAQDGFLAGRGIPRIRYDADFDEAGNPVNERLSFEAVSWRDYREGPAKRWEDVPWVAYKMCIAKETYDRMSDQDLLEGQKNGEDPPTSEKQDDDIDVWEYWDRLKGKVCFVREDNGKVFKEIDDPLGLPGFFPSPKPLQPICLTGKRTPVCPFSIYKKLADELDETTKRINKIMKGLKVRGVIAGNASALVELAAADDNEIKVLADVEQLMQTGGLDKAIAWWPVEQAIKVLAQLYANREQLKSSIYEITGISDIVRGASQAGETATAQNIKTQWGSLRIKKMQTSIERLVREMFVMSAHILVTKFDPQTLTAMTGIEITPGIQQMMQEDISKQFRINVETDSTVRADLTQKKKEMAEFLAGSAQFFQVASGIVQTQPAAAEPMAEIYAASARMFRLGKEAEDALERFTMMAKEMANNPPPNPEIEKAKAEIGLKQAALKDDQEYKAAELNLRREEMAASGQADMAKAEADMAKYRADGQKSQIELAMKQVELEIKRIELAIKQQESQTKAVEAQARVIEATAPEEEPEDA